MAATISSPASKPGFGATLASEWTKLRSVRATYIQIFLAIALSVAMTALICLAIGATWDDLSPEDQADFELVFMSVFGAIFGLIVLVVMGVTIVSSEYTSGMMRLTLTVTPRPGRVLAAKLLLVTLISLAVGAVIAFGSFIAGQIVFSAYDIETQTLTDSDVLESLLGLWLTTPVYVILAAAIAVMLRSTASAITAVLALIFVPSMFGALLPTWAQENVLRYMLGSATDALVVPPSETAATYLEPLVAVGIIAVWLVVFVGVAYALITRRDV